MDRRRPVPAWACVVKGSVPARGAALLRPSELSRDVFEEAIHLVGVERRGTSVPEVDRGVDQCRRGPAAPSPRGTLELRAENVLDREPPGAAGLSTE